MARHPDPANEVVYALVRRWIDTCVDADGSLLTPGEQVWTIGNLDDLYDRVYVHGNTTPGAGYWEKLEGQVADARETVKQLAAEVNVVHFLSVHPGSITGATKREGIRRVLGGMTEPPVIPDEIASALDHGFASPGRHALQRRDTQIASLMRVARSWKALPPSDREDLHSDPWAFAEWARSAAGESEWMDQLQMVLHYFHPSSFEPIVSVPDKKLIAARHSALAPTEADLDRKLLEIRRALSPELGDDFHWYAPPVVYTWRKGAKWSEWMGWAQRVREHPTFESDEITYKVEAARELADVRRSLLDGDAEWGARFKRAFRSGVQNIVNYRVVQSMLPWVASQPEDAADLFASLWQSESPLADRVGNFAQAKPDDFAGTPGLCVNLASYLLMAEGASEHPPFKASAVKAAYALAGWEAPDIRPEARVYQWFLAFCDEMVHDSQTWPLPLRNRLEAQSAMWVITKVEDQGSWPTDVWNELLAYRGSSTGSVANTPGEERDVADGVVAGCVDHLGEAAKDLHLDRGVLEEIVDLLRDKGQVILYGPPGTGKTYLAKRLARAIAEDEAGRYTVVQFHPAMSYEDFVEGFRPEESADGGLVYRRRQGHLLRMAERARSAPESEHVMVIDEINRANLPKVLGELLFLLEYRKDAIPLLYQPDLEFTLPEKLWFIGTMNTADRSIALIDAALRRRFHFKPFFPTQTPMDGLLRRFLADKGFHAGPATFLDAVNGELLSKHGIDEHVLVGPSHFMNPAHYVGGQLPEAVVERIWTYNVFPLIEELFWGQRQEVDSWRWPEVRRRHGAALGIVVAPEAQPDDADSGDGPSSS